MDKNKDIIISCVAIIPARYASSRFPGKPLAMLNRKPIIQHVYERVEQAANDVYVAVDDERVANCVSSFGGKYIMTSPSHHSGTDRIAEAYTLIGKHFDVVVNVQGDEPFIRPEQIKALVGCFAKNKATEIATVVKPMSEADGEAALLNVNTPKVVVSKSKKALYFSRSVIPFVRGKDKTDWLASHTFYKHIGIYAFRPDILAAITRLPQGDLEKAESLEQLRWLENDYSISVVESNANTVGIDTPADLKRAEDFLREMNMEKSRFSRS